VAPDYRDGHLSLGTALIQTGDLEGAVTALKRTLELDPDQSLAMFKQISEAIKYAHLVGVIHRHLSPDHILLENWDPNGEPAVRVSDFGFMFDSRYQFGLLEPKTPKSPFDSPEAANNDAEFIDRRTDIFSLGKILKLFLRIAGPREQPVTEKLTEIVNKSTSLRRRGRYNSVEELLVALSKVPVE
jgi:serine/threonine protein kinase